MALLQLSGIKKLFGATAAVGGVDVAVNSGEVHAVIGENGAGKSTLMNILSGAFPSDMGEMRFAGEIYSPKGPCRRAFPRHRPHSSGAFVVSASLLLRKTFCLDSSLLALDLLITGQWRHAFILCFWNSDAITFARTLVSAPSQFLTSRSLRSVARSPRMRE